MPQHLRYFSTEISIAALFWLTVAEGLFPIRGACDFSLRITPLAEITLAFPLFFFLLPPSLHSSTNIQQWCRIYGRILVSESPSPLFALPTYRDSLSDWETLKPKHVSCLFFPLFISVNSTVRYSFLAIAGLPCVCMPMSGWARHICGETRGAGITVMVLIRSQWAWRCWYSTSFRIPRGQLWFHRDRRSQKYAQVSLWHIRSCGWLPIYRGIVIQMRLLSQTEFNLASWGYDTIAFDLLLSRYFGK